MNNGQLQFAFDGRKISAISRRTTLEISVKDWTDIGVEILHDDSLRPAFCLVINRQHHNLRIPNDAPVFKALLDYFSSLDGFDWQPLVQARLNPSHAYSLCWRQPSPNHALCADASSPGDTQFQSGSAHH